MRKLFTLTLLFASCMFGSTVFAQWGGGGGGWGYHSSTAGEGYQRGAADLVRSAGMANLMNSEAAGNLEDAKSKNLDNRLKYAETFYAKRQQRDYYEKSQKKPLLSDEYTFRMNQRLKPQRLTPSELDPVSGELYWPLVLTRDEFAETRAKIDAIFADQTSQSHIDRETYDQITNISNGMRAELSKLIKEVPSQEYMKAKKFLESLMYEAQVMTG